MAANARTGGARKTEIASRLQALLALAQQKSGQPDEARRTAADICASQGVPERQELEKAGLCRQGSAPNFALARAGVWLVRPDALSIRHGVSANFPARSTIREFDMSKTSGFYATWHTDPDGDATMAASHAPYWRHFIDIVPERDLSGNMVLDFGCNRGGFLRLLHQMRPFRRGVGIDIASESIAAANAARGDAPLEFAVAADLSAWADTFDIAFSYEVIYLLPDLLEHGRQIYGALREGGVYYAVTGCHTKCPLWPRWRELIARTSNTPVPDHSPDDFTAAFQAAGFDVSVKRFGFDGFVPATKDRQYYPSIVDALAYPAEDKLLFRLVKR